MELKLNLSYSQILKLIYQLPDKEKRELMSKLRVDFFQKKKKSTIQKLILKAPTWNEEQLAEYRERKEHINKSRLI